MHKSCLSLGQCVLILNQVLTTQNHSSFNFPFLCGVLLHLAATSPVKVVVLAAMDTKLFRLA